GELDAAVDAGAAGLHGIGIEPGDRVALVLGNVPAFVEAYYAVLRAGAIAVPLNPGSTADELRYVLEDSGARAVVVRAGLLDAVVEIQGQLDTLEHVIVVGETRADGLRRWRDLLAASRDAEPPGDTARGGDDLAALVYTSGTTGRPKAAMLTHANLAANQDQSLAGRFRIGSDDTVLLVLPLFHIYALNVGLGASLKVGASMLLLERFDPATSLEEIAHHDITIVLGAPPMYIAWLGTPGAADGAMSSVRLAVSGAAALPAQVLERFEEAFGLTIEEGYGLTEASPSVTSNAMAPAARPGSVGLPLPQVELKLVDDEGREVQPGDPGEVLVRGPNVFAGYWKDDDATAAALTEDGWLRTGDVGTFDEDGYLFLVDRKKDLIIVSGFNVYPREVERALYQHPGVAQAAVVGIPHPYTGEAVRAYVVPRDSADLIEDDLIDHCRTYVARYKCPTSVEIVDELPHTAIGKVRRVELREED
ncbi:MAG: long-chain fatty acid--CoA ligase, partial [Nitriliruptorales bacterium]|nr:long-chain fatty acid--CoA ligase [Nitriliruptorales bacterium]